MIVKVTRGGQVSGLMAYLVGPGSANEHESPHLVAGSAGAMAWYSTNELSGQDAAAIGSHLDKPRLVSGTAITAPVKEFDEATNQMVPTGTRKDAHVWHCSLSMPPKDTSGEVDREPLGDELWGQIAEDFAAEMGFTEASGKSPCRWVAVHHGSSKNGGDHIHLAVNLVREDGTKASTHYDYKRASQIVAKLEVKYGLEVLEGRTAGRSSRPESRAEVEQATRTEKDRVAGGGTPRRVDTYSAKVSRKVRACAAASADEGEFVRRCRREDLWVKPRFAAGSQDVVTGYSVAERPEHGQAATWRAAGHLGRDLTLPRLRDGWEDSPAAATEAASEWNAAWRGQPPVTRGGRESADIDPALWTRYADEVKGLAEQLRGVAADDHSTWAQVAHETSGAFAAWSLRLEPDAPGPLAETSDMLAKSATLHRRNVKPSPVGKVSLRGPASLLMAAAVAGPGSRTGQALMIRQLANMARALFLAQKDTQQARIATQLSKTIQGRLREVAEQLPTVDERGHQVSGPQAAPRGPGSPVPNPVQTPTPAPTPLFDPSRDSGIER